MHRSEIHTLKKCVKLVININCTQMDGQQNIYIYIYKTRSYVHVPATLLLFPPHTHSVNLNAPPVFLQMQSATSGPVGPRARESTTWTSEEHYVLDPVADVVSVLVLRHARKSSSIQQYQIPYLSLQINLQQTISYMLQNTGGFNVSATLSLSYLWMYMYVEHPQEQGGTET